MPSMCCVPYCKGIGGHQFPREGELRKKWFDAIGRTDFKPGPKSVVCHQHFHHEQYVEANVHGEKPLRKLLKRGAVPCMFNGNILVTESETNGQEASQEGEKSISTIHENVTAQSTCATIKGRLYSENDIPIGTELMIGLGIASKETPFSLESRILHESDRTTLTGPFKNQEVQTMRSCFFSLGNFVNDDRGMRYYTGFENYAKFKIVLMALGPEVYNLKHKGGRCLTLSIEEQFFLTVIRLHRHLPVYELSRGFEVSESVVRDVFNTWINFMFVRWEKLEIWRPKDLIYYVSTDNYETFPTTCVIVKRNQFARDDVQPDWLITSKHVNVDRIIGLAKTYKILQTPMACTDNILSYQILFTCLMLCSFHSCITGEDA